MTSIQSNTEYDYNTTTIQMAFKRKSNDLFGSVFGKYVIKLARNLNFCAKRLVVKHRKRRGKL